LGNQTVGAGTVIGLQEPMNLAAADMEQLSGLDDAQSVRADLLYGLEAIQLFLRYDDQGHGNSVSALRRRSQSFFLR
jgi:hypothetical protein